MANQNQNQNDRKASGQQDQQGRPGRQGGQQRQQEQQGGQRQQGGGGWSAKASAIASSAVTKGPAPLARSSQGPASSPGPFLSTSLRAKRLSSSRILRRPFRDRPCAATHRSWLPSGPRSRAIAWSRCEQERQARHLPDELQEFGLPVLQRSAHQLRDIGGNLDGLIVLLLLLDIFIPAENPVPRQCHDEQPQRDPGIAVA